MTYLLRLVACLFLCVSLNSFGALYDRGNGLIYDDVLDITWLQDANYAQTSGYASANAVGIQNQNSNHILIDGRMGWDASHDWVSQLEFQGHVDWRLPSANFISLENPCFAYNGSCDTGYNNASSELGYMFYMNLNNPGYRSVNGVIQGYSPANSDFIDEVSGQSLSFLNLQSWTYLLAEDFSNDALIFDFYDGGQGPYYKSYSVYSWPVHDGDIGLAPVPLPAGIYLFLSGLVGLGLLRGRS